MERSFLFQSTHLVAFVVTVSLLVWFSQMLHVNCRQLFAATVNASISCTKSQRFFQNQAANDSRMKKDL